MNPGSLGALFVQLLLDDKTFGPDLAKAQKAVEAFGAKLDSVARAVDEKITAAFQATALAVAGIATAATITGAAFEKQMSKVAAVSGATKTELAALTEEARRIGSETMFSATEAAQGMEALAQAGFTPREVITATADAMNLAGAAGMELGAATELVAATLTQFSLTAADAGRVSDVLTQASASSLLTAQDLAVALRYAGAAGAAMGYSLEETTAAVAQFRNMGLTGEQSGTNFRSMLESLANPTEKATGALAELGLKAADVDPTLHSFDEILQTLHDRNLSVAQSFQIFGTVSGANVARLAATWDEAKAKTTGYTQTLRALMSSSGAAAQQFGQMADNVAGRWDQLTSAIEEGMLTVFDMLKGPLSRLLDGLGERVAFLTGLARSSSGEVEEGLNRVVDQVLALVDKLIVLSPYLQTVATLMVAAFVGSKGIQFASAIIGMSSAIGVDLVGAVKSAVTAFMALDAASAAFTVTGIGAIIAGVALLTAAFAKLMAQMQGAVKASRELQGQLAGQAAMKAADEADIAALEKRLKLQQAELQTRLTRGEALSKEEQQIARLSAATAHQMVLDGELLDLGGRLAVASSVSVEDRRDQIRVLEQTRIQAAKTAATLGGLVDQYAEAGVIDAVNDRISAFNGALRRASTITGENVDSLEALKAKQTVAAETAERARKAIEALSAGIVDTQQAANVAKAGVSGAAGALGEFAAAGGEASAASKKHAKELEEEAKKWREVGDAIYREGVENARYAAAEFERLRAAGTSLRKTLVGLEQVDVIPDLSGVSDELNASLDDWARPAWKRALDSMIAPARAAAKKLGVALFDGAAFRVAFGSSLSRLKAFSKESGESLGGLMSAGFVDSVRSGIASIPDVLAGAAKGVVTLFRGINRVLGSVLFDGAVFRSAFGGTLSQLRATAETSGKSLGAVMGAGLAGAVGTALGKVLADATKALPSVLTGGLASPGDIAGLVQDFLGAREEAGTGVQTARQGVTEAQRGVQEARRGGDAEAIRAAQQQLQTAQQELQTALQVERETTAASMVDAAVDSAIAFVETLAENLDDILARIADRVPSMVNALIDSILRVAQALADELPGLVDTLMSSLPDLVDSVTEAVTVIIESLPEIVTALLEHIPQIIDRLVSSIPRIVAALVAAAPRIIGAIIRQMPKILLELYLMMPKLVLRLLAELTSGRFLKSLWNSLKQLAKDFGKAVVDVLTLGLGGLFRKGKGEKKDRTGLAGLAQDVGNLIGGIFGGGKNGAYSGIEYVPATMRMTVHRGEAVIPADRNAARVAGPAPSTAGYAQSFPSGPGGGGWGGGSPLELAVLVDGQVVDGALVGAAQNGRAPKLTRMIRQSSGVTVGLDRGRYSPWSK
jgi:TP901 family phage tail tape measure protein